MATQEKTRKPMHSITQFFSTFSAKKGIILALTPLLTMIFSMGYALVGLAFLLALDLITGINKSLSSKDITFNPFNKLFWLEFKSYGLRQSWKKSYEYAMGVIAFAILETYFMGLPRVNFMEGEYRITEIVVFGAGIIEAYSIYENLRDTKNPSKFILLIRDVFGYISKFLPDFIKKRFEK